MKKFFVINFKCIKLFIILLASIVGVGFITGSEIYYYFASYGYFSIIILLNCVYLFYKIMQKMLNNNLNYNENYYYEKITLFSNFLVSSAMFSGLFEISKKFFNSYFLIIILISFLFIFFVIYNGINHIFIVDLIVIIFLIFVMIIFKINVTSFSFKLLPFLPLKFLRGYLLSFLYVFMNIVELRSPIEECNIKFSKKSSKIFSSIFSINLFLIILFFVVIFNNNINLESSMPFVEFIFVNSNNFVFYIYIFGLFLCLISTLFSCLLGIKSKLKLRCNNFYSTLFSILPVLVFGLIPFEYFVIFIYPAIGFVNLIYYFFFVLKK